MGDYSVNMPASLAVPTVSPAGRVEGAAVQDAIAKDARARPGSNPGGDPAFARSLGNKLDLEALAEELERYMPSNIPEGRLQIDRDEESGMFVYKTIDPNTGEVLRQYPTDEMLRYISYHRKSEGLVVDDSV